MTRTILGVSRILVALFALILSFAAQASLQTAIWTTVKSGERVNQNLYDAKEDVYLNGGPQNDHGDGLPDGQYYFMVTDPSGAVLLSTDDITCRQVTVTGGVVSGSTFGCHANGDFNPSNGSTGVQLVPYDDTPNPGGVYKVWLTKVEDYAGCDKGVNFGFCHSDTKTDNFKVRAPGVAHVTACKFEDVDGNGVQDSGDLPIASWTFTATGVDGDSGQGVTGQTDSSGCVSFTVSTFVNNVATVTMTEGTLGDNWAQTAPQDGSYVGTSDTSPDYTVTGGVVTTTELIRGDEFKVWFGNHRLCATCGNDVPKQILIVTKDANPAYKVTWSIDKSVDTNRINTSGTGGTFNYTVSVSHDAGSGFVVNGTIHVASSPFSEDVIGPISLSDSVDNGGDCSVTVGTIPALGPGDSVDVPYTCTYSSMPLVGTNTAKATWTDLKKVARKNEGTASVDFANATVVDGAIDVTDTLKGSLGQATYTDPSPKTFTTYPITVPVDAGKCATQDNTASFTSTTPNSTPGNNSASQTVTVCRGADLTVSKTATPSFTRTYKWNITKDVDRKLAEQAGGGSAPFNYTVKAWETGFDDTDFTITGTITVSNPNTWQAVTVNVTDAIDGGPACTVTGGSSLNVPAGGSNSATYSCSYGSAGTTFTNKATAAWDKTAYNTPNGSATGSATKTFGPGSTDNASANPTTVKKTITVTDTFNAGTPTTLGTLTATDATPFTSSPNASPYTYQRSIPVPTSNCLKYSNTAKIVETGQSAGQTVEVCGPAATGALTIGYWQNKNGQGVIAGANQTVLRDWLKQFHPFSDATAPVATYVTSVMSKATCTSTTSTCNSMLKAQMLATALNVYFSSSGLGGKVVDLTKICKMIDGSGGAASCAGSYYSVSSVFGGASSMSVMNMLLFQNTTPADPAVDAGANWYLQAKANQVMAKDAFDAINNQVVFVP